MSARKIIQITTAADDRGRQVLAALADDGSVWTRWAFDGARWVRIDTSEIENSVPLPPKV